MSFIYGGICIWGEAGEKEAVLCRILRDSRKIVRAVLSRSGFGSSGDQAGRCVASLGTFSEDATQSSREG